LSECVIVEMLKHKLLQNNRITSVLGDLWACNWNRFFLQTLMHKMQARCIPLLQLLLNTKYCWNIHC